MKREITICYSMLQVAWVPRWCRALHAVCDLHKDTRNKNYVFLFLPARTPRDI